MNEFTSNDWETPDSVAKILGSLILPTDRRIIEPAAGRGQIVKQLPQDATIHAYEIKRDRVADGIQNCPNALWKHDDFLGLKPVPDQHVIIANPPFSDAIMFLSRSMMWLDPSYPHARCLFLLPVDFFQSKARANAFNRMNCYIKQVHMLVGRVAYFKEGQEHKGRQIYDAIFDIRPGAKIGGVELRVH